jgi:hypothetical protein
MDQALGKAITSKDTTPDILLDQFRLAHDMRYFGIHKAGQ